MLVQTKGYNITATGSCWRMWPAVTEKFKSNARLNNQWKGQRHYSVGRSVLHVIMEFMDSDKELFLTQNCYCQEVFKLILAWADYWLNGKWSRVWSTEHSPRRFEGKKSKKDRQIHGKLQQAAEWLLMLMMKNFKWRRHLEYTNKHIVGRTCLVWMGTLYFSLPLC